ncbi:hypothetical protein TWF481_001919 [Arthrobotrys musiformis]|uniref:Uncharacterized protein n=1 Tax=Arthrobotrys musiformis TaxID=47236 RepID=A0AAV9VW96_9PEZI
MEGESLDLATADLPEPDPDISVNLSVEPDKEQKEPRGITSQSFYTWTVVCPNYRWVMRSMPPDPESYPKIGGNYRPDPLPWPGDPVSSAPTTSQFVWGEKNCRGCRCSDGGEIILAWGPTLPKNAPVGNCRSLYALPKCKLWFGCRCEVTMHQPGIDPGNSIEEYQNALNDIPFFVKAQNPAWRWNPMGDFSMSWRRMGSEGGGNSDKGAMHEENLAPGEKERYYLEGPNEGDSLERDLKLLRGSLSGIGGNLGGIGSGSRLSWKRSETGEEGTRNVLQENHEHRAHDDSEK